MGKTALLITSAYYIPLWLSLFQQRSSDTFSMPRPPLGISRSTALHFGYGTKNFVNIRIHANRLMLDCCWAPGLSQINADILPENSYLWMPDDEHSLTLSAELSGGQHLPESPGGGRTDAPAAILRLDIFFVLPDSWRYVCLKNVPSNDKILSLKLRFF
ncbi:MAG: hypothetical protein SO355_03185 [Candidatus Faecousia sp.]|nr:hypothetical protein [Candidatus Faecousia sp.]